MDSGSNGLFFNNTQSINLPTCGGSSDFYCPATAQSFTATLTGAGAAPASTSVTFTVGNASTANSNDAALPTLAGSYSTTLLDTFDWGLNFFYNRRVANAIEGQATAVSTGPYVAF